MNDIDVKLMYVLAAFGAAFLLAFFIGLALA
jgi:hypothetical protein